jgi:sugar lactone lactonase YvrE
MNEVPPGSAAARPRTKRVTDGLSFTEGPRWHQGALWFSDIAQNCVVRYHDGALETMFELPKADASPDWWGPSGLGFLPDGSLLVVAVTDRRLYRFAEGELSLYVDLSDIVTGHLNDMVVDGHGRAYVGASNEGQVILISPDRRYRVVASGIPRPNGCVITPDGSTYICASEGNRIVYASVAPDGSLGEPKLWADMSVDAVVRRRIRQKNLDTPVMWSELARTVAYPDGICLDSEGALWVGSAFTYAFLRVLPGGAVTDVIETPGRLAVACALGGDDRDVLYMLSSAPTGRIEVGADLRSVVYSKIGRGEMESVLESTVVDLPGAGWP